MSGIKLLSSWGKSSFALLVLLFCGITSTTVLATDVVTTEKSKEGWKLLVNGEPYYVKGMVWGYTPKNQNYTYNLWGKPDDHIRKVLDYDFTLLKAAGVNTIRAFSDIPPKWVTYAFEEYGIRTTINPLMGRYGYMVNGRWVPNTDYSDRVTRSVIKDDILEIVEKYKDVPGVLMFALGNENNYGLSWSSFEIENLPEGERHTAKARFLYSLYNDIIKAAKQIDSNHPFSIVNGDIQYIDLIKEIVVDLDVLGSNVYRGKSFTNLWSEVDAKLDVPVVFYEFGSDAFNAKEFREDQKAQALILKDQWLEMYNKAAGNGEEGNSIGGFVFEWRDEWWKYKQEERLDIHDNNASWANGGYPFDFVEGQNNMNEEWFGIAALGDPNADGVYTARPRMAYDVLTKIWQMDPYANKRVAYNRSIDNLDLELLELKGEVRQLKEQQDEARQTLRFTGGNLMGELVVKGTEEDLDVLGEDGLEFEDGQMAFLDFAFNPSNKVEGQFTLNILGNVANKEPLEIQYGRRGLDLTIDVEQEIDGQFVDRVVTFEDRERIEIYDFDATYRGKNFDINAFYHVPRYHWGYEGDFFGLMLEATDLDGQDIWNAKAPSGIEFTGKGAFDGLKVVAGPEVYWGANPKVVLKYSKTLGKNDVTLIHAEDIARRTDSSSSTAATSRQSRQTALHIERPLPGGMTLELGGLISSTEEIDELYDRVDRGRILLEEIEFKDTLAFKAKLSFPLFGHLGYISTHHAGLVADGGNALREFGTRLPYSGFGNKEEYEAGLLMTFGNLWVFPRVLYRENLVNANPNLQPSVVGGALNPGTGARDTDNDPFAVLDNREARSAELFLTWDPTGATPFYQWDNDLREDAKFAWNLALNYTEYPTATDSYLFFFEPGGFNAPFGVGLPPEEVWEASTRMIYSPNPDNKIITTLRAGSLQSTGDPNGGTRDFWEAHGKYVFRNKHIVSGYFKKDAFGPYDFHRQFNVTYPEQFKLDYSIVLDGSGDQFFSTVGNSTRIGIRTVYRGLDENSPAGESQDGINDYIFQTVFYFNYQF